jgi:hypothetical protein
MNFVIGHFDDRVRVICIEESAAVSGDGVDVCVCGRNSGVAWRNDSISNNRHTTRSGETNGIQCSLVDFIPVTKRSNERKLRLKTVCTCQGLLYYRHLGFWRLTSSL